MYDEGSTYINENKWFINIKIVIMRNIIILIISFLSSLLGHAQITEKPVELEDALLWEISGNGLQKSSYLLGTMHIVEFSFMFDSIPGMRKVFSAVEQVATEVDMMDADLVPKKKQNTYDDDYFFMPSDTTYSMLYSAQDFSYVDSILSAGNARYAERVPAFWQSIYIRYRTMQHGKALQKKKQVVMDYFVSQLAHQNSKKTFSLEDKEEVMGKVKKATAANYKASLKKQASDLLYTLKNTDRLIAVLDRMDSLYRARKLSQLNIRDLMKNLTPLIFNEEGMVPNNPEALGYVNNFYSIIAKERNSDWMPKITEIIHQGSTLIAVGALHLTGESGLINQLRKMGYTVKPVE